MTNEELAEIRKAFERLNSEMSVLFEHIAKIEAYISLSVSLESPLHDKASEKAEAIMLEMAKQVGFNLNWKKP